MWESMFCVKVSQYMMRVLHKKIKDKNQDKGCAQRDKRLETQEEGIA